MDKPERLSDGPQHPDHGQPLQVEELIARMRVGKKEVYEVRIGNLTVPVRIVTCDEVGAIRRAAMLEAAKVNGDETDKNLAIQKATLKLASNVVKGGIPFLNDKVLALLTLDEMTYLYNEYIRVMDNVNPSLEEISPERFRAIVDALKKKHNITERLIFASAQGNLHVLCGSDPETGDSNLTTGQLTWWTACRVAEAEEAKEAARKEAHRV